MEKRAIIYIRVSDPSQIDNNSLETQEKVCRQFAKSKEYEVVRIFREEGESAKHVATRTQLTELIKYCANKKNNISRLIVYKLDRLSRNMAEGLQLIAHLAKYGVLLHSATEQFGTDSAGTFLKNIIMAAAQFDNESKGEKVKDNMQAVFRGGLWPFKCPIGYKRQFNTKEENKNLPVILDPNLAPIIKKMFENASTGIYTKSVLARMMNLDGFAKYYRVKADHKIVQGILKKSFYYGHMYAKKWNEYAEGKHEPLIDETTWQKAYHYLILKKKNYQFQDVKDYPLKGYLICEYCNHPMTTSPSRGNGGRVNYYECRKRGCTKLRIASKSAHEQFEELLTNIQPNDRVIGLFESMVISAWDKVINQKQAEVEKVDHQIIALKDELKSIRKAKDDGLYTVQQAKEEADNVQQQITVLDIERGDMRIDQYNTEIVKEFSAKFMRHLNLLWDNLNLTKRQVFLQKVFLGSVVCSADKKIRTAELSPSFELIHSLNAENGENVTPPGFEPGLTG